MTRTAATARAALREAVEFASHRGARRHTYALYHDPHRPGGCIWAMTPRDVLPLTRKLLVSLAACDLLLLGRYEVTGIVDRTTTDFGTIIAEDDPVRELGVGVALTAHPAAITAVHHVTIILSPESEERSCHVVLSALQRPEGWPP